MDDNMNPMAQPAVPNQWPNSGDGFFPGHELYDGKLIKPAPGTYVTELVALGGRSTREEETKSASGGAAHAFVWSLVVACGVLSSNF